MKIYSILGTSEQVIIADGVTYTPAPDEIEMQSARPDGDYVAAANGTWVIDKTPALEALTEEYTREKANLCEAYTTASMQGDTETAQSVAADMADLDAWFDEEYRKIEEGSEA
jgi:hypothetical protein